MPAEIHVGDVGTVFEATILEEDVAVNLSSATVRHFKFQAPDGTITTKTATLTTDGSDGKERYAAEVAFLFIAGVWFWQPYLEFPDWQGHSDIQSFMVHANLG